MSELDTKQTHAPKEKPNAFASPPANKHVSSGKEKEAAKLQEEFKNRAEKVVTPQQLEDLEKQYKTRMEKL
ncbi:MAG TPA: hypothetical protein PKE31_15595 [Pseudomonadota bacterium]|nr:hypothetical protein [Pseudomonadota bacterium]